MPHSATDPVAECLQQIAQQAAPLAAQGRVASYIPGLESVDPRCFGMAVATLDGRVYKSGLADAEFSLQSITKVFSLVLACQTLGDAVWQRVGRSPSSNRFNSLIELELEQGKPRNPFINAGALVIADCLSSRFVQMEAAVVTLFKTLSGRAAARYDQQIAKAEFAVADRNRAAAYLMKSLGNFVNPVEEVVRSYCAQCALVGSCVDVAQAALFLAHGGTHPATGAQVVSELQAHQICALMMSSGTYEASGETSFLSGLPVKSGVAGGVLAVIPGYGAICVWSPPLDAAGNSVAGMKALELFSAAQGLSLFGGKGG